MSTSDQIADNQQVHGDDDRQRDDVGEREERDEQRRTVATMVLEAAEVVRRGVGRQRERLDAIQRKQRRVGGEHRDPDRGHDHRHPFGCRHRAPRGPDDGDETNDGDGDQRVDGDVDCHVEDEVRQLTGDVSDQPVVGGVMVRHERHGDNQEEDVTNGEIQQQQVDGRPHCATCQCDVDNQRVADRSDADDQSKHHRNDDLVQDVVKQQLVAQVNVDVDQRGIKLDVTRRCYQYITRNCRVR